MRVERGTSCWLAGKCAKPNAYLYDEAIGEVIRQRFGSSKLYADTSLWVTVERRFIWLEGCVASEDQKAQLRDMVRDIPDADLIFVDLMVGSIGRAPYTLLPADASVHRD